MFVHLAYESLTAIAESYSDLHLQQVPKFERQYEQRRTKLVARAGQKDYEISF